MGGFGVWIFGERTLARPHGTVPAARRWARLVWRRWSQTRSPSGSCGSIRSGDSNMRSVWLCSRNDVIGNCAVLLAALGVIGTSRGWPDVSRRSHHGGSGGPGLPGSSRGQHQANPGISAHEARRRFFWPASACSRKTISWDRSEVRSHSPTTIRYGCRQYSCSQPDRANGSRRQRHRDRAARTAQDNGHERKDSFPATTNIDINEAKAWAVRIELQGTKKGRGADHSPRHPHGRAHSGFALARRGARSAKRSKRKCS